MRIVNNILQFWFKAGLKCFALGLLLLYPLALKSQEQNKIYSVRQMSGKPLENVQIIVNYGNNTKNLISDDKGLFRIEKPADVLFLKISHIGFKTLIIQTPDTETFIMEEDIPVLDEVKISSNRNDLLTYTLVGFNSYQVTYIPCDDADINKSISALRYNTIDVVGVKGLKFLPFAVNLFCVDSLTGLPGEKLLPDDIIVKRENKGKWVEIDIKDYNIQIHKKGIYVALKTLEEEKYKIKRIESKLGVIEPVPALKIKQRKGSKISFISHDGKHWEEQSKIYEMDILLNE